MAAPTQGTSTAFAGWQSAAVSGRSGANVSWIATEKVADEDGGLPGRVLPEAIAALIPVARVGEADEIAEVACWLALDRPGFPDRSHNRHGRRPDRSDGSPVARLGTT